MMGVPKLMRVLLVCAILSVALALCGCAKADESAPASSASPSSASAPDASVPDSAQNSQASSEVATRHISAAAQTRAESYKATLDVKMGGDAEGVSLEQVGNTAAKSKRYTLMVYMIGSNLESINAGATEDLNEMIDSGLDFSQANVVVYAGGTKRWNTEIPAGQNSVLDLSLPKDEWVVAQTGGCPSMGAPEALASFVNYCNEHYPAEQSALVFWDHGGGPFWGFGQDELSKGDGLLLSELRQAMEATPYAKKSGKKLDWVGFDACLMGCMENVALWGDYANYLVASEETEPGDGWDYSFLARLNADTSAEHVGEAVVESYGKQFEGESSAFSNPDATLALYDLGASGSVLAALDRLFDAMRESVEGDDYGSVNKARRGAKAFGLTAVENRSAGYDIVDAVDLASRMRDLYPEAADGVIAAVGKLVVSSYANVERASGLSFYFPGENLELFNAHDWVGQKVAVDAVKDAAKSGGQRTGDSAGPLSTSYDKFVDSYASKWISASEVDWTLAEAVSTEDGITLQLTPEQAEATSFAGYTVIQDLSPDWLYNVTTCEVSIEPDENNMLHVPADPVLIGMQTDISNAYPGTFIQVEEDGDELTFTDTGLYLMVAGAFEDLDTRKDMNVTATVSHRKSSSDEKVTVESLVVNDGSVGMGGKSDVDASRYTHLVQANHLGGSLKPTYDEKGGILPWDEWEAGSGYWYRPLALEDTFEFVAKPASEYGGKYVCQIVVTDVNGIRHAIAPVDLPAVSGVSDVEEETVEVSTKLGAMTFTLKGDYAELSKYEGDDWTLDIPTEVSGVPVTTIGQNAFARGLYLDELSIPEGITAIGHGAFEGCNMFTLKLPSSLEHCSKTAFVEMKRLKSFELNGTSKAVSVRDGVLFSADGKTLLAYPNGKGTKYKVPAGTEVIAFESFAQTDVESIELSGGVREIQEAAFYGCESLAKIALPDSLEYIGSEAFDNSYLSYMFADEHPIIPSLRIGPNVSHIGARAFHGLQLGAIEVDERNETYSSKDGALLNAAGDMLLEAPRGVGNLVRIPDGIVALDEHVFSDYASDSEFILPDSMAICYSECFPRRQQVNEETGEEEYAYTCTIHASEGSYGERFAEEYGIPHDSITDVDLLTHESKVVQQGDLSMLFWVYADRATLVSADDSMGDVTLGRGKPHKLSVPDEVSGKPVTKIDMGRDAINRKGTGDRDDHVSSIETMELPATLESFGDGVLSDFDGLKRLSLDSGNESFEVVDDVLFTKDGEELVAYPHSKEGPYRVPDGVKTIGSKAFCYAKGLTSVEFSDGVKAIGDNAFYCADGLTTVKLSDDVATIGSGAFASCSKLEHVDFGSGLELVKDGAFRGCSKLVLDTPLPADLARIGEYAFSGLGGYDGLVLPENAEWIGKSAFSSYGVKSAKDLKAVASKSISIGPYLEFVGDYAFLGLDITEFVVADNNDVYKANGPFLLSKDGADIAAFASGFEGEAHVPEGVKELGESQFSGAYRVADLYLPVSVMNLSGSFKPEDGSVWSSIKVHVPRGSYAERRAIEKGLEWSVE